MGVLLLSGNEPRLLSLTATPPPRVLSRQGWGAGHESSNKGGRVNHRSIRRGASVIANERSLDEPETFTAFLRSWGEAFCSRTLFLILFFKKRTRKPCCCWARVPG